MSMSSCANTSYTKAILRMGIAGGITVFVVRSLCVYDRGTDGVDHSSCCIF